MGEMTTGPEGGIAAMEGHCGDGDNGDGGDSDGDGDRNDDDFIWITPGISPTSQGGGDDDYDDYDHVLDDDYDDYRNKSNFDNGGFSGGRLKTAGTSSDPALGSLSSSQYQSSSS